MLRSVIDWFEERTGIESAIHHFLYEDVPASAEMMAMGSGAAAEQIMDLFRQDLGYGTPRVGVRAAAFRDHRVLMVREVNDGRWALPGGWADVNQTASECIEREVRERLLMPTM